MVLSASLAAGTPAAAVDVIAHRGASAYAPENTLAAFQKAHELGADWFELDCTLTKDGEVVVIHDDTLDKTTGTPGRVADFTLEELKKLDAGSWFDPKFAGERLPTLGEALDFARGRIGVYIEIKNSDDDRALAADMLRFHEEEESKNVGDLTSEVLAVIERSGTRNLALTRAVINHVRERQMEKEIVIQSFSGVVCAIALLEAPELRVELLASSDDDRPEVWPRFLTWAKFLDMHGFNVNKKNVDARLVHDFHQRGKTIAVWTVNEPTDVKRMIDLGVDAIITDKPDVCLQTLQSVTR